MTSQYRWALVHELRGGPEPGLKEQLARLAPCDLVLVESFKNEAIAKLEVHRTSIGKPLLFPQDPNVVAIASELPLETLLPQFRMDKPKKSPHLSCNKQAS